MRFLPFTLLLAGSLIAAQSTPSSGGGDVSTTTTTSQAPPSSSAPPPTTTPGGNSGGGTTPGGGGGGGSQTTPGGNGGGSSSPPSSSAPPGSTPGGNSPSVPTPTPSAGGGSVGSNGTLPNSVPSPGSNADDEITEADNGGTSEQKGPIPGSEPAITPDEHKAENENLPERKPSKEEAKEVAVLETAMFETFVNTAPAPGDKNLPGGAIKIPANVSQSCTIKKRSLLGGWSYDAEEGNEDVDLGPLSARQLLGNCQYVMALNIDVYVHYMRAQYYKDEIDPPALKKRVAYSFEKLNEVYGAMGITFNYKKLTYWNPPKKGSNSNWTELKKREERLVNWQKQTYTGNKASLNVWIVDNLKKKDGIGGLNGYGSFPIDADVNGKTDGVVMRVGRFPSEGYPATLMHEIGHWMGLDHVFGVIVQKPEDDCKVGDGLLKTTLTRGLESQVYDCEQAPCGQTTKQPILNWMSYSGCRGRSTKDAAEGFTSDQKSAMFARYIQYRRGYRTGECRWKVEKTAGITKRGSMQDLVEGRCPDVDKQAEIITNAKTGSQNGAGVLAVAGTVLVGTAVVWTLML